MAKQNGGPVTPQDGGPWNGGAPGMSRRQWLAGMAMCGQLSSEPEDVEYESALVAKRSYNLADAMLAEEERRYGKSTEE
jgi:hypothetical protein